MNDWLCAAITALEAGAPLVKITVLATRGSVPREVGASMLVTLETQMGTIGGGHLEWDAIHRARDMLDQTSATASTPQSSRRRYALGASLGQCCGGAVELSFEAFGATELEFLRAGIAVRNDRRPVALVSEWQDDLLCRRSWARDKIPLERTSLRAFVAAEVDALLSSILADVPDAPRAGLLSTLSQLARESTGPATTPGTRRDIWVERVDPALVPLWIFGAGHVAQALVRVIEELPFALHWIDNRDNVPFGTATSAFSAPLTICDDPVAELATAPANALHLVMTHNHELDFEICRAILSRGQFRELGLIGSATKIRRFAQRLEARGVSAAQFARMTAPIGVAGISSKSPAAIAVSVAAQLLQWIDPSYDSCKDENNRKIASERSRSRSPQAESTHPKARHEL